MTRTSPPAASVESYAYDAEGNRLASNLSPSYVTDDADRVLDDGINTYEWSRDGELTKRTPKAGGPSWSFSSRFFASGNAMRLDTARASDETGVDFFSDPFSRLVAHHWGAPRGNDELYYDGPDVALELRHTASGEQWLRYVHGPNDDQPLATEVYPAGAPPTLGTGQQFYYHADGEGSIRLLTNAQGQLANRYDYDRSSLRGGELGKPALWLEGPRMGSGPGHLLQPRALLRP